MISKSWVENIEIGIISLLCVLGGILGTRMKWHTKDSEERLYDRRRYLSGLYLAAGAGLVTGLLGQGLRVNKAFLMGSSIVAGYAGGKRFFEWIQKLLSLLTAKRFAENLREGGAAFEKIMHDDKDSEERDDDPP